MLFTPISLFSPWRTNNNCVSHISLDYVKFRIRSDKHSRAGVMKHFESHNCGFSLRAAINQFYLND